MHFGFWVCVRAIIGKCFIVVIVIFCCAYVPSNAIPVYMLHRCRGFSVGKLVEWERKLAVNYQSSGDFLVQFDSNLRAVNIVLL